MRIASYPLSISDSNHYRCAQVIRILRLMHMLQSKTYLPPLENLASTLEVTTRTIRRDIEVLRLVGARVPEKDPETKVQRGGRALPAPHFALDLDEPMIYERERRFGRPQNIAKPVVTIGDWDDDKEGA